jgi:hypothetical protein
MRSEIFCSETKEFYSSCKRCLCLRNADNVVGDVAFSSLLWILTILWRIDRLFHKRLSKFFFPAFSVIIVLVRQTF